MSDRPRGTFMPPLRRRRLGWSPDGPREHYTERCLLGNGIACPRRQACESDVLLLAAARAGSRKDFDALYERFFPRCFQLAQATLPSQALSEACTREVLMWMALGAPADGGCLAAELWEILQRGLRRRRSLERTARPPPRTR